MHIAVDTLGHLLALKVTAADQGDREQVAALAAEVQQVTGSTVELAYVDQGYTGQTQPKPRSSTASGSKWSNTPWPNEASCSCPAAGLSKEASPGPHAFAGSPETTNDSTQPSKASTTSPSLYS